MNWNQFILKTNCNKDHEVLLFNTLNKAVITCDSRMLNEISEGINNNQELPKYKKELEELKNQEFLISKEIDEKEYYMSSLRKAWEVHDSLIIHFLPTMDCNFKCVYCYQDGVDRNKYMNRINVDDIIKYLDKYLEKNSQINILNVTIHGGEPTYHWGVVPYAMLAFKKLCDKYNLELSTSIVSNSYLLTKEKSNLLYEYNWNRLQVTLDGIDKIHDKRRILINGGSTFQTIVNNLKYILENNFLSSIDLRINFDSENWNDIPEFIDYIDDNFDKTRIFLSFGNITQTIDETKASRYINDKGLDYKDFINKYIYLYNYAVEKGFYMLDSYVFGSMCTAKLRNSFIFAPDSLMYKCLSMVGREEGISGNYKLEAPNDISKNHMDFNLYEECFQKKCPIIPICHTDCRFDAYVNLGDFNKIYCRKNILIDLNKQLLEGKYL